MKTFIGGVAFAALLAVAGASANDVGLINYLAGEASYTSGGSTAKAKPYIKLREGDRVSVAAGTQMRVVYFRGGRQETYMGPGSFTAGTQQGTVQSGAQPQVSTLPSGVSQKIAQTPELIQIAKLGRSGGVAVRGAANSSRLTPQQQAEVRQARQTYEQLRQGATGDDITPELFLYSVLQDHLLYNDMKAVVSEMQRRQPANPDVAVMAEYVKVKTEVKPEAR
jgi:hypothetical protein